MSFDLTMIGVGVWVGCFVGEVLIVLGEWSTYKRDITYADASKIDSTTKFAQSIQVMDAERYSALGIKFPELNIRWEGKPVVRIDGTKILLACFQKFLMDSDEVYFVPERHYNNDKTLQGQLQLSRDNIRAQWWHTVNYLLSEKHITPDSMKGSHTFIWIAGRRQMLLNQFVYSRPVDFFALIDEVSDDEPDDNQLEEVPA